ncbi:hypothetical protein [Pseudoalteromonas sp. Z1A8]|uniref:hypothetical protein n=1 Tax=Pseudoalteromonas sp. Z1A8 TaxID=2686354 RepID=UPI0014099AFA|nr:hypothetical protein [Pseudoalteromonas sp. Z1A8]
MLDTVTDFSPLEEQLSSYLTDENSKRIKLHISSFKLLLLRHSVLRSHCHSLLQDIHSLFRDDYWLKLEILSQNIPHEDDLMFRRCLSYFASAISENNSRPSRVFVFDTNIDLLHWYRKSFRLGKELNDVISAWGMRSTLAKSSTLMVAQTAQRCLKLLFDAAPVVEKQIYEHGLLWFNSTMHFRQTFNEYPIKDKHYVLQSALFSVLEVYQPNHFQVVRITINDKSINVTDLADIAPVLVEQLQELANSDKFKGELEHNVVSITMRFINIVGSIRKVAKKNKCALVDEGLDGFKKNKFALLKEAKALLRKEQFAELLLLLEQHLGYEVHSHEYIEYLLPFYFEKEQMYRHINYSKLASQCPEIATKLLEVHSSEIDLLPEKNYGMITLYGRFTTLNRLLINFFLPNFLEQLKKYGFKCLSLDKNRIQKSVFQYIQSDVKSKIISLNTGMSYFEAIRWIMAITGQAVVEAYKLSSKRQQRHARRMKIEDLYSDQELRELIFYIEKGIKETDNVKQLIALYFARIQVKSCWNTSPMADIELNDITEVSLPTAKKSITVLIQKPRKGYDTDPYSLDGRTVNSVMRDIVYVKDTLTHDYRHLGGKHVQNYLFIFKEKTNVSCVLASNIIAHIKSILSRLGCTVNYDSMRIRKNGANHLYREVAKQMRAYESAKIHTFDTFIKHYQRVSEEKTQQTLHTALDVMQRYFTGREIVPEIKVLMVDDSSTQKTPTGECASQGNDGEASQYGKEHRHLSGSKENGWCSDFLACVWCKHFRTVADPDHVWQLLSYRDYVLTDMAASISDIENNEFQQEAIAALHQRVNDILEQVAIKNPMAVTKGKELMAERGMHPFWAFAVTSVKNVGDIL